MSYGYNARGWLKSQGAALFNESLNYEEVIAGVTSQYNGNISRQQWGPAATPTLHTYTYTYDRLNRLTTANSDEGYNEQLGYDVMGNISRLQRKKANVLEDQLKYTYTTGNRLASVLDSTASVNAAFQLSGTTAYTYNANGNMLTRSNTANTGNNLSAITYNHMNLPSTLTAGTAAVVYTYDASGNKLRKQVASASINNEYISGINYEGGVLKFVSTPEGRVVRNSTTSYTYEFTLADHLGNGRVYFDINGTAARKIQEVDYYAFGLDIQRSLIGTENKYQYNGKEKQDQEKMLDYGARFYDPVIGRFNVIDRFSEKYYSMTSYQYGANNPIRYIDINGDSLYVFNPNGTFNSVIDDGREKVTGIFFRKSTKDKDGNAKLSDGVGFGFNDLESDREDIKSGNVKIRIASNSDIEKAMDESGVDGTSEKWKYIERESRPRGDESLLSGKSEGKMDYAFNNSQVRTGYLNIVIGKGGTGVAYNMQDFGNFLWGQGGKRLGFGLNTLRRAAHLNNAVNSGSDNPGSTYHILDSNGDQRAIKNGYYHNVKPQENGSK